jgi:hypothetical protein
MIPSLIKVTPAAVNFLLLIIQRQKISRGIKRAILIKIVTMIISLDPPSQDFVPAIMRHIIKGMTKQSFHQRFL